MANLDHRPGGSQHNTPRSVTEAFDILDRNISMDPAARVRAGVRHREVEAVLKAAGLADGTFLQGSFARKTMRRPLKDVDIVVLLPQSMAEPWKTSVGATRIHEQFKMPLLAEYGNHLRFDETAMAGKALQLSFSDVDFSIDLVAAFADPDPNSEWIEIADRQEVLWEPSSTRTLLRLVGERNHETVGRFIHQVRMFKEFKAQQPGLDGLCGLAAESLAYAAVDESLPHSHAVATILQHAAKAVAGPVLDPTGVDDLSAKWTDAERGLFSAVFSRAATQAGEAMRLEQSGQITPAIDVWSALLGEDFPMVPRQSADDAIAALASGSVTSTGRATTSTQAAVLSRPTRAWRCR
jgi:hypothetical protein